jgi:hypothetical protein
MPEASPAGASDAAGAADLAAPETPPDAAATPPDAAADTLPLAPPLSLPDLALWLDGDVGLETKGPNVLRWLDRSLHHQVFVAEGDTGSVVPAAMAGHQAVHFDGRGRLVCEPIEPEQQAALTVGSQDFVFALVVRAGRGPRDNETVFGLMPSLRGDFIYPPSGTFFSLSLNQRLTLRVGLHQPSNAFSLTRGGPFADERPRLVVMRGQGDAVSVRINGAQVLLDENGRRAGRTRAGLPLALPFAPVYLGNWDFDQAGLTGDIAEVVLIIGPGATAALPRLEPYLRGKYGL